MRPHAARRHRAVLAASILSATLAATPAAAVNRQFNTLTAASGQPLPVNPATETLETCPTCAPPTHSRELLEHGCPTCPKQRALPPPLQGDCEECGASGEDAAFTSAPYTTVVDTCPDCEPFELHPRVGWNIDNDTTGTGVYLSNGNLFHRRTDIDIPGRGFNFRFVRRHVSGIAYDGPLGQSWDFTYNMRIVVDGDGDAWLHDGTGRADEFDLSGGTFTTPTGRFEELTSSGSPANFSLTKPNGTVYTFDAATGNCKLESITDRAGNAMSFSYDGEARLSTVTDTLGRTITLGYDSNGRITTVTDFDSRVWTYAYTSGDWTSVTTPGVTGFTSGKVTTYAYDASHRLDTITDPKSQLILDATYTSGKVTTLRYGDTGDDYTFTYTSSTSTTVTDRLGNEKVVTLSAAGQPTAVLEKTNRNVRAGEGDYTTSYTFNSDGMLTRVDFPKGNKAKYAYATGGARSRTNLTQENLEEASTSTTTHRSIWTYASTNNLVATYEEPRGYESASPSAYRTTYYYDLDEATQGDLNGDGVTNGQDGVLVKRILPQVTSQSPSITPAERYRQNSYGQLTWWEHPDGEVTTFEYHATGDQTGYLKKRVEDDVGGGLQLATEWGYSKVGNITSIKDPRGNTVTYTVNALNQVTRIVTPISATIDLDTNFEYDANDNRTKNEVENLDGDGTAYSNAWITTTWTYERLNRVATRVDEVDATKTVTTTWTYDKNRNVTNIDQPEGNDTSFTWDERGLLYKKTCGAGSLDAATEEWTYDGNRMVTAYKTGAGNTDATTYDAWDRPTTEADPGASGNKTVRAYDHASNVTKVERKNGSDAVYARTDFEWNQAGWLAKVVAKYFKNVGDSQTDYITAYEYRKDGQVSKVIDPKSHDSASTTDFEVTYGYDGARRRTVTEDDLGNKTTLTLDGNGNVTTRTELDKAQAGASYDVTRTTDYTYDKRNLRLTEVRDPGTGKLNLTTTWKHDSRGNRVSQVDPRGNTQAFEYDGRNLRTKVTEDLIDTTVAETIYRWDDNGRLEEIEDDNGHVTSFTYDALNRRTLRTDADADTYAWEYRGDDAVTERTDENGTVVADTLDELGRVTHRDITRGTGVEGPQDEDYEWDAAGRLTKAKNDDSVVEMKWDSLGRMWEEKPGWGNPATTTRTISRDFDRNGNVTKVTYPDGTAIDYAIDANLDRIDQVKDGTNVVGDYRWLGAGLVDRLDYLNGVSRTTTFDAVRRITEVSHDKTGTLAKFTYTLDANSNVLSEKRSHNGNLYEVFTYDERNQLDTVWYDATSSSNPSVWTKKVEHDWDGVFNLDDTTTTIYQQTGVNVNYTANSRDQYTSIGGDSPLWTDNGELKDDDIQSTYKYDYRSQLTKITRGATNWTFKFDALGRRITTNFGTELRFTWAGNRILEEITDQSVLNAKWVWGVDPEPLRMNRGGTMSYYHANRVGSVEKLTDTSGAAVESVEYEAFGKPSITSSGRQNTHLWRGLWHDFLPSLYAAARVYDPSVSLRYLVPMGGSSYQMAPPGGLACDPRLVRRPVLVEPRGSCPMEMGPDGEPDDGQCETMPDFEQACICDGRLIPVPPDTEYCNEACATGLGDWPTPRDIGGSGEGDGGLEPAGNDGASDSRCIQEGPCRADKPCCEGSAQVSGGRQCWCF
jgi:YD repeat-containing protein